jgi:hypothetical protein
MYTYHKEKYKFTTRNSVKMSIVDEILRLINMYDLYVEAIDDGTQYKDALASNRGILKELQDKGVLSITYIDHIGMWSTTPENYTIQVNGDM